MNVVRRISGPSLVIGLVAALLAVGGAAPAGAHKLETTAKARRWPAPVDPKSWVVPEDMTWADYTPIPGVNWKDPDYQPTVKTLRAALILGDFTDQKMRVAETTTDASGQRGLGENDPAKYWVDLLFKSTDPNNPQHGHTVGEYWLEDSYGAIGVDAEGFGPYTMDGPMYQYGVTDFGDGSDCPDDSGCGGDFDTEVVQKSLADVTASQQEHGEFDFRFLLHAGYDESGVWLNYGLARFESKEDVTDEFGPPVPDHRNWANTRYVDWTSFFAAQNIWSHALPGTLATEGESDGGSVYAHELSHVLGILDNYNNPYAEQPDRAYTGPWDMMSRGSFNGPGGPLQRYTIPPSQGATMGSHHMLRNKIRLGFTPASEVFPVTRQSLAAGPVKVSILQRESPPPTDRTDVYSGLRVTLGQDMSSCDDAKPKCDGGGYDYYDVEVVNRQGFDSFIPDHGVLIAKSKTADQSPFVWVQDAHPKNLRKVDYVRADGQKFYYTVGDYRQLADAAFHAGTSRGVKNSFVDKANELAFFVLAKHNDEGRALYDVAVQSTTAQNLAQAEVEPKAVHGKALKRYVFTVTNSGSQAGVWRLKASHKRKAKTKLLNDLLYLGAGESQDVTVYARGKGKVGLAAKPAIGG